MSDKPSKLKIAGREFTSRLLVGTGKFASNELMRDALVASGTEIVTVALRRADISGKHDPFANILDFIDPKRFLLLPNTSGARNADEAVRFARVAASAGLPTWIKLEIHPDPRYVLPDPVGTLAAAEVHAAEAMEMGADAVLVNTAIAIASDPVRMAKAFKKAIEAGREAREIGLAEKLSAAAATSPLTGFLSR